MSIDDVHLKYSLQRINERACNNQKLGQYEILISIKMEISLHIYALVIWRVSDKIYILENQIKLYEVNRSILF